MNYYISDLHLFHKNVTRAGKDFDNRPFDNLEEMHSIIKEKWNAKVTNGVKKALKKTGVLFRRTKLALELGNLQIDVLTDEKWLVFVLEHRLLSGGVRTSDRCL